MLANMYLEAESWPLIHFIEHTIDSSELNAGLRELYELRVWSNYLAAPEEYWEREFTRGPVNQILSERSGALIAVLRDRSDYLREESATFYCPHRLALNFADADLEDRQEVIDMLILIEREAEEIRVALDDLYLRETVDLEEFRRDLLAANELILFKIPYSLVSPRYGLVVYEAFLQTPRDVAFYEISREVLLDSNEDVCLRILAADYLAQSSYPVDYPSDEITREENIELKLQAAASLAEQIHELLDDGRSSGQFVDYVSVDSYENYLIERELLVVLRQKIVEEDLLLREIGRKDNE
jgi:hypothetical protein